MTLAETLRRTWSRLFSSVAYERDTGFRDVILGFSRKGMLVAGVTGIVATLAYLVSYVAAGRHFTLADYSDSTAVALWDKLLVLGLSIATLGLARTRFGLRWGRLIVAVMLFVFSVASLLDDVMRGNVYFAAGFLGLVMMVAVAVMPYHPWQAVVFSLTITGAYLVMILSVAGATTVEGLEFSTERVVFLLIVTFICGVLSSFLYNSRYEQYRARRSAEQLKEAVTEQAEKLVEMDRLKSRFFANISHEFRTPLTLILGPLENFLARSGSPIEAEARPQLEVMHRNARRLLRLINQLLDLSKLEAGSMSLRARRGNIVQYLKSIVRSFVSYAERKKIDLQFHADSPTIPLYFDPDKVEKMLFNLLSNAFKFTPEGGTIRVSVTETGSEDAGTVEVRVKDTGAGIPKDQIAFIFDRFHQVEDAVGQTQEGTGIGLALVNELVERHGGAIRVESDPGFGSAFTITLPKGSAHLDPIEADALDVQDEPERASWALYEPAPSELALAATTPPAEEEHEASHEVDTLLVVDDNADVRAYLRDCLAGAYHVVEAQDGQEGLEKARAVVPDLILADVMMPRMDGYALCRHVKADDLLNHVPVILLTARASDESKVEGLETGADDYLFKPFNAEELRVRVRNLIALRRRLRARFSREILVQPTGISVQSADEAFVDRAREMVEEHMADEAFNVEAFAGALSMGPRQLQRKLRALTGQTPTEFIRLMRLKRAAQLLEQHAGTVSEIAYEVGFNHPTYFATCFREVFGTSPSAYSAAKA